MDHNPKRGSPVSILTDHRPHPWRAVKAVVTKHGDTDGHHVDLHVADEPSITDWLESGDPLAATAELAPVTPVDLPQSLPYLEAEHVTVHRELSAEEAFAESLATMQRETQALADTLTGENDTRMTLLLSRFERLDARVGSMVSASARAWEAVEDRLRRLVVTRRRRRAITPLVLELGALVQSGDVSEASAVALMGLRSRYLDAVDDESQRLPRLTPELLAELDRTLGMRVSSAPVQGSGAPA